MEVVIYVIKESFKAMFKWFLKKVFKIKPKSKYRSLRKVKVGTVFHQPATNSLFKVISIDEHKVLSEEYKLSNGSLIHVNTIGESCLSINRFILGGNLVITNRKI